MASQAVSIHSYIRNLVLRTLGIVGTVAFFPQIALSLPPISEKRQNAIWPLMTITCKTYELREIPALSVLRVSRLRADPLHDAFRRDKRERERAHAQQEIRHGWVAGLGMEGTGMAAWPRHSRSARDCVFFFCSFFFLLPSASSSPYFSSSMGAITCQKPKMGCSPTSVAGALVVPLVVTSHHRSPPSLAGPAG